MSCRAFVLGQLFVELFNEKIEQVFIVTWMKPDCWSFNVPNGCKISKSNQEYEGAHFFGM